MDDDKYMIWLAHSCGVDSFYIDYLMKKFEGPEGIYLAKENKIRECRVLSEKTLSKLLYMKKNIDPDKVLFNMQSKGIKFISKFSGSYPALLKAISNPPFGLFMLGTLPDFDRPWVSVIGTRKPTSYGKAVAYNLSGELAKKGIVIVSGMADGLDGIAHKAVLEKGGSTVAVLGCGVDICYPIINERIYEGIKKTGCIISEFPPAAAPDKWHFPYRNRIISGLSSAVVVIEAEVASGTAITVKNALEQGREVLAVPGNITSNKISGTNNLIREGAHVVTCAMYVLDALGIIEIWPENNSDEEIHNNGHIPLATNEETVYSLLSDEPAELDNIIKKTSLKPQFVMVALTKLKLAGIISELPGQKYIKNRK